MARKTISFPNYEEHADTEERSLAHACECKDDAIGALALAAEARKARGADTTGIEESLDYERLTRAGYQRALDNRRRELRQVGGELVGKVRP